MAAEFPLRVDVGVIQLRRREPADIPELIEAIEASIEALSAFVSWAGDGVPTAQTLRADVLAKDAAFEDGNGFEYVVREAASGELVGEAGGGVSEDSTAVDIGYWVRTDRVGRGYATMAAAALTTMAFAALPAITRVEIRMDKGNVRSRRVAERLGFQLVGEETFDGHRLTGQTGEGYIWVTTRDGWQSSLRT